MPVKMNPTLPRLPSIPSYFVKRDDDISFFSDTDLLDDDSSSFGSSGAKKDEAVKICLLINLMDKDDTKLFLEKIKVLDVSALNTINWDQLKDKESNTLLHWIAKSKSPDAIQILLYLRKAQVHFNFALMDHNKSIEGKKGKRPLAYVIENKNIEMLKFILEIYKFEFLDIDGTGRSAIELALEKNSPEMVQLLSDHYYQFNEVCSKMIKAKEQEFLKWAVNNRKVKFIMTLLFQELDVNIVVSEGKNLLQWALDSNLEFQEKKELMSYLNSNYKVIEDTP